MSAGPDADRLVELLRERELDSLLVTNLVNVRYLTGFTGTNGACVVTPTSASSSRTSATWSRRASRCADFERIELGRDMLGDLAKRLQRARRVRRRAPDRRRARASSRRRCRTGSSWCRAGGLVERLRAVKDEAEVASMRGRRRAADRRVRGAPRARPGRADRARGGRRARALHGGLGRRGAVVPADRGGGRPRRAAARRAARRGDPARHARRDRHGRDRRRLLLRLHAHARHGLALDDERSRSTSSCCAPRPSRCGPPRRRAPSARRWTRWRATSSTRPGHEEHFGHGLGHGVGLEIHEAPRLGKTAEGSLEAGNAVTVEPGVYLPGSVGVRIEDLVIVTDGDPRGPHRLPEGPRHRRLMALAALAALAGAVVQSATGFGLRARALARAVRGDRPGGGGDRGAPARRRAVRARPDRGPPSAPLTCSRRCSSCRRCRASRSAWSCSPSCRSRRSRCGVGVAVVAAALWQLRHRAARADAGVGGRLPQRRAHHLHQRERPAARRSGSRRRPCRRRGSGRRSPPRS